MTTPSTPAEKLRLAYQPKGNKRYANPLDVIGFVEEARYSGPDGEKAVMPLFLGSPMFFWEIAQWVADLDAVGAREAIRLSASPGWDFGKVDDSNARQIVLSEVSRRVSGFTSQIYPLGDNEVAHGRFDFNRNFATTYIDELWKTGYDGISERRMLLKSARNLYREWFDATAQLGVPEDDFLEAAEALTSRLAQREFSASLHGVGRTRIMLERSTSASSTPMGLITASVLSTNDNPNWSPAIIPDIRSIGLLRLSDQFMESIAKAWKHYRRKSTGSSNQVLVFAIRPTITQMLEQVSGRSAEASILAAIESSATHRALRHDVVASAKTELDESKGESDPDLSPLHEFSSSKMSSAHGRVDRVVVHESDANDYKKSLESSGGGGSGLPKIIGARKHRRDVMRTMEVRSNKGLAFLIPFYFFLFFFLCGAGWQLVKLSYANIPGTLVDPPQISALVLPSLLLSELFCFVLCAAILFQCVQSCRLNLDSLKYALLTVLSCTLVVAAGTLIPVGVRGEGWVDLPFLSVLFGQPQIKAQDVIHAGGLGALIVHSLVQFLSYVAIVYGSVAMTIRLRRSRAATEVIVKDRIQLTILDYVVCKYLLVAFVLLTLIFGLVRNGLWHLYLEQLDGVLLFDRGGALVEIFAPLIAVCATLIVFVAATWTGIMGLFLHKVVDTTPDYTESTTTEGMLNALPSSARYLARIGRIVHLGTIGNQEF